MKKIIWWIVGGVLLTTIAFFIPEQSGSMWPSVISSSIAALLYIIAFSIVWLPKIESQTKRRAIAVTFGVLIVFSAASATISYEGSVRQLELLPDIRTTIETSIAESFIKEPLLETLRIYHSSEEKGRSLGKLFTMKYDSLITEDSVFTYGSRNDDQTFFLYVDEANKDSVILVGESSYVDGEDADFTNFSGVTGRYQVRGILTSQGVDYERQN
jgi:hypothetical protein